MDRTQRLLGWNQRMNGLPRKTALVAVTFAFCAFGVWILQYIWPFAAAFLFSRMLEPFVRFASKGFSRMRFLKKKSRSIAALLGLLLLFGIVGALATALVSWLFQELAGFLKTLPQLFQWLNDHALPALLALYRDWRVVLPAQIPAFLENAFATLGQNALRWAASLSGWLTSGAWSTAASIPNALLGLMVIVIGTYYLAADRQRIAAFFMRIFPSSVMQRSRLIRESLVKALIGQLRSQMLVSLAVMFFLMLTLGLSGVRYGVIIGILIGAADALPVLGAGVFLLPWSAVSFLTGQTGMGVTLLCLYVGALVIRQILEPRLVGKQLGLHPLATMLSVYAGYRFLGAAGLLGGPVLLYAARAVLEADQAITADRP